MSGFGNNDRAGRLRRYSTNLFLVLLGFAAAVLLIEGALRVWNPIQFRVKGDRIVLPVNQEYRVQVPAADGGTKPIVHRKNSIGFRGPEPLPDMESRLTIIAIGGSTTESFYLSDGMTWPDLLARRLATTFPGLWLNNAGLDGHSTFGHAVLFNDHVRHLHPKVVLLLVGANDIESDQPRPSDRRNFSSGLDISDWRSLSVSLANKSEFAGLLLNLYRVWKARDMGVVHKLDYSSESADLPPAITNEDIARILARHRAQFLVAYRDRLKGLIDDIRKAGALPVLLTQPSRLAVDDAARAPLNWRVLELYNDVTREFAGSPYVVVIDLARELPRDRRFFYDDMHLTELGSAAVADVVAPRLCTALRARWPNLATRECG